MNPIAVDRQIREAEPYLSDFQMSLIEARLREEFPECPDTTEFATMIQPPTYVERSETEKGWLPSVVVYFARSKHPTIVGAPDIVGHASTALSTVEDERKERTHFVDGREDINLRIFKVLLRDHLTRLTSMKEIIH